MRLFGKTEETIKAILRAFFNKYAWIHISIGLIGNILFLGGSIMFLFESLIYAGTWLFIAGALLMLIGSTGDALIKYIEDRRYK